MNEAEAQLLAALQLGTWLSLPLLGSAFGAGLLAAGLASLFRLSESALTTVPRALATLATLAVAGGWLGRELVGYAARLFRALPELVQ